MATSPETGDPAATLEEVRENSQDASYTLYGPGMAVISRRDLSALLAAIEAALKLADDWDNEAVRLDAVVGRSVSGGERATRAKAAAQAHKVCADALHAAITREITGKGERDDR